MAGIDAHGPEDFDPISLEILWNRLISIVDESAVALLRTAFSNVVRESNDYACALMDANADSLAENTLGIPSFVGVMSRTMKHFLAALPRESWKPGNVAVTNDPWLATGHLLDVTTASPLYHRGKLVAFFISVSHMADIGGMVRSADGRSVYEEGLRILPMWLLREGKPNEDLLNIIRGNIRVPGEVISDLMARATTGLVCERGLTEFMSEQKLEDLSRISRALQQRAETSMRRAIEQIPDGTYRHEVTADGYDAPIHIKIALTVKGSDILVDYDGTSPELDRALNSVMNYTFAYTAYPIKCALDPFTPKNEGSYRSITVVAPEGCVLNPRFPAPVAARSQTGHWLSQAVFGALAQVIPDKVMAESGSAPSYRILIAGQDATRKPFSVNLFGAGGMGARSTLDGLHCTSFPTNTAFGSVESIESTSPLRFPFRRLRVDSGGPGRYRGGFGQHFAMTVDSPYPATLSVTVDRIGHPARGLAGGLSGAPSRLHLNEGQPVHPKSRTKVQPGDVMQFLCPGGGGYGDPKERDRARTLRDTEDGIITREAAREHYGVIPSEGEIGNEPE